MILAVLLAMAGGAVHAEDYDDMIAEKIRVKAEKFRSENPADRQNAAQEMVRKEKKREILVSEMGKLLADTDGKVREKALYVLGEVGVESKALLPKILALLDDPEESVSMAALIAVGRIAEDPFRAIPAEKMKVFEARLHAYVRENASRLGDKQAYEADLSATRLGRMKGYGRYVTPQILPWLQGTDVRVTRRALSSVKYLFLQELSRYQERWQRL